MSSINTNLSAMTALQSLKTTQSALSKTQGQISTGLRVGEASHNASYWSIATQMKSDNGALGAVKDAIGQSKAMINTFTSAMDKALTYLNKMKEGLVTARQPGADLDKIQGEFAAHIEGMKSAAASAVFNEQNWVGGAAPTAEPELVVSYDGSTNKVQTLKIDTTKTRLFEDSAAGIGGLLGGTDTTTAGTLDPGTGIAGIKLVAGTTTTAQIDAHLLTVDAAIKAVTEGSAMLGANKALLETQEEFIGVLSDSLEAGVSTFVDADMNEASTRLQALQTQQQLGVQALSIANQNSQMILKLFQ
ncbi:flagellin [Microvirga massiliensis]|uniref:flagellin N-terminal helical domain-containing protein n=1 Tax=Microvirga massiliensis TaxID=1033741 RepID=UPI00062BD645|nr:flagellin [Microvirga massiliensis]